ncbi:MAG: DinB family protein [Candidatus Zixiibacteriota bacterium]|nr:MAG: DinB family protein [candidate division Zixibacteria bacterium]
MGQSKTNALLVALLDQAYNTASWHGTSFRGTLRGLKLPQLLWRPSADSHNIWEITLHVAYWKYIVWRKLTDAPKGGFPRRPSDWPRYHASPTVTHWKDDLMLADAMHRQLRDAVRRFPDSRLDKKPAGSKWSYAQLISGVAAHDLYHTGQVQLLKRLLRESR